jgi:hypothetical protein
MEVRNLPSSTFVQGEAYCSPKSVQSVERLKTELTEEHNWLDLTAKLTD